MSQLFVRPPSDVTTDEYFGGCPNCGGVDLILNVSSNHWGICDEHLNCWWIGSNLFSSWREESEAEWAANSNHLSQYQIVEPIYPPDDTASAGTAPANDNLEVSDSDPF